MTIRDQLIQAMANTYCLSEHDCPQVLDAMLAVLSEHADEWYAEAGGPFMTVDSLLAVLADPEETS